MNKEGEEEYSRESFLKHFIKDFRLTNNEKSKNKPILCGKQSII